MEFILEYPAFRENWYLVLFGYIKSWYMKKQVREYQENDLLID